MAVAFFIMYFVVYGLPLMGSAVLVWLAWRFAFKRKPWGWPVAIVGVAAASSIPWGMDRIGLRQDLAAYAPDTIMPDSLDLPPGVLWHLQDDNHAGITCGYQCAIEDLAFATSVEDEGYGYGLQLGPSADPLGQHNLWDGLYQVAVAPPEPFPYHYAYIGMPQYQDFGVPQSGTYRKSHWPDGGKGVHMLVRLPEDGMLDFATADILYRRYNIQREMALPFLWGVATSTVQEPSAAAIMSDLIALSGG